MRVDQTVGYLCASWNVRVGKMALELSWFPKLESIEQKKEAPSVPLTKHCSVTV